jgi:hypothetical protein
VQQLDVSQERKLELLAHGLQGVIGSTDGTFILGLFDKKHETLFYTGYKHIHGWKLLVTVSHFTGVILDLTICAASVSDPMAYLASGLSSKLGPGVHLLGDNAFHNKQGIIPGYLPAQISHIHTKNPQAANQMKNFNLAHSHYRIKTENTNRELKLWATVRGRSDARMHSDKQFGHGTASLERQLRVIWSLENMKKVGFFSDRPNDRFKIW